MTTRRLCAGPCGRNRALRFFPVDNRAADKMSKRCIDCHVRKRRLVGRNQRLQETYGITEAEYRLLFEAQGGRCAICKGARRQNLDVDHDHKSRLIRGLCCRRCNRRLLPAATDSIEVLYRAIEYLTNPPAVEVLGERRTPR